MKTQSVLLAWILSQLSGGISGLSDGESISMFQVFLDTTYDMMDSKTGVLGVIASDYYFLPVSVTALDTTTAILFCEHVGYETTNPGVCETEFTFRGRVDLDCTGEVTSILECSATVSVSDQATEGLVDAVNCTDQPITTTEGTTERTGQPTEDEDFPDYLIAIITIAVIIVIAFLVLVIVLAIRYKKRKTPSKTTPVDTPPVNTAPASTFHVNTTPAKMPPVENTVP